MIQILLEKFFENKKKEHYNNDTEYSVWDNFTFGNLFLIVCIVCAVYLSWTCEENKKNYHIAIRVFFAFLAAIFNLLYIIVYLLFMQGTCKSPKGEVNNSISSIRSSSTRTR